MALKTDQKDTGGTFALPAYKMQSFDNTTAFNDYISSPEYKTGRKYKGVCWGL